MKHIAINAQLLASGNSYRRAGIHRYIYNTLTHLATFNHSENWHYTVFLNQSLNQNIQSMQEKLSRMDTSNPVRRILWEQFIQPFHLHQMKPDLYHAMAFVTPYYTRQPSIVTIYDLSFMRFPEVLSRSRRQYLKLFTRRSCQKVSRIIAISESTARDIVELFNISREKIDVAVPGVDDEFKPLPEETIENFRQKKGLPDHFFLFIGTLEPRKNLPMLLRAYAALKDEEKEHCHLVLGGGKGWLYDEIFETIATHQLENTVHTPGYIPADELALWYNAADAFVYPTIFEGFGIPILEAMACGKAVLASDTSSLPEAVGNAGLLLPPDNEKVWTEALSRAIHDHEWQENSAAAGLQRARQFNWAQTAHQTITSYRQILA